MFLPYQCHHNSVPPLPYPKAGTGDACGQALGWDLALGAADGHSRRQRQEMPQIQMQPVGNLGAVTFGASSLPLAWALCWKGLFWVLALLPDGGIWLQSAFGCEEGYR